MSGRCLAVGDIHGSDAALKLMLEKLDLQAEDTLVLLGDVVDKGPHTPQATERLMELREHCRLIYLRGNHEQFLLQALQRWAAGSPHWEGIFHRETFLAYGGVQNIPQQHVDFWQSSIDYWETDNHIFVHASLHPGLPLERQDPIDLRCYAIRGHEPPHVSGKRVICGHQIQANGLPKVFPGWVCLDTGGFHGGYLSCLNVETDWLWQTSQTGDFREGELLALRNEYGSGTI